MNGYRPEEHAGDLLPELARGELPEERRRAVEAHLASCERCREELEIVRALLAGPAGSMSSAERTEALAEIRRRRGGGRPGSGSVWKTAAAVAAVAAGLAVWQLRGGRSAAPASGAGWSPAAALAAWESDVQQLRPDSSEVEVALGLPDVDAGSDWSDVSPSDVEGLAAPWEGRP